MTKRPATLDYRAELGSVEGITVVDNAATVVEEPRIDVNQAPGGLDHPGAVRLMDNDGALDAPALEPDDNHDKVAYTCA